VFAVGAAGVAARAAPGSRPVHDAAAVPSRPSRTAVIVCHGRAAADDGLAVGRFSDPVALRLLADDERLAVEQVRACAEGVVPRTVAIDEAVRRAGHRQVVVLGAGLDTRGVGSPATHRRSLANGRGAVARRT
jgi:O-methyltransferase involved in polyketide biosynthesis